MARWHAIAATLLLTACASSPAPQPIAEEAPALPREIHWARNSAEYRAVFEQTFRLAGDILARRVAGREAGGWAVAIDADETLIDNSEVNKELALTANNEWQEHSWDAWIDRREAPALPGARTFLERVRELGGRIAVVTNRHERHCPQTVDNLRLQELPFDVILCRGESRDKMPRWRLVEAGTASPDLPPVEIVMWVGDNIHDFPGLDQELRFASPEAFEEFGERFFVLPNPMYGSWRTNAPD